MNKSEATQAARAFKKEQGLGREWRLRLWPNLGWHFEYVHPSDLITAGNSIAGAPTINVRYPLDSYANFILTGSSIKELFAEAQDLIRKRERELAHRSKILLAL